MTTVQAPAPPARPALWWWAVVPGWSTRVSFLLPQALTDGAEWAASLRRVAVVGPPVALLLGLVIGWWRPGFQDLPTESLVLLVMILLLGAMSAALGLWLLAGYAVGDLLSVPLTGGWIRIGGRNVTVGGLDQLWLVRPGQLVSHLVLAVAIVVLPVVVKLLTAEVVLRLARLPDRARPYVMAGTGGVVLGGLVFFWAHAAAPLLRPRFTWAGTQPTYAAIGPLQETAWVLAVAAGAAFAARFVLQAALARRDDPLDHASMLVLAFDARVHDGMPWTERLPWIVRTGALITIALAVAGGIIETWPARAGAAAALFAIALARSHYVPPGLVRRWQVVARVPLLLRLVVIAVVARLGLEYALAQVGRPRTWATLVVPALAALVVAVVLLPPLEPVDEPPADGSDPGPVEPSGSEAGS